MNKEMNGWIVSLWIDSSQIQLNNREELPYLSWSPYDRVTIDEIIDFSDFFKTKEFSAWNGTVQRLHLIPMLQCNLKPGKNCLIDLQKSGHEPYGIYCIITARFQNRFVNINDVKMRICNVISMYLENRDIQWQAFHSLGAEDFVGIFLANNIAELAEIGDIFKQITYTNGCQRKEIFASVYSFFGLNNPDYCQEPKADLIVRLHIKTGFTRREVRKLLEADFEKRFPDIVSKISISEVISGRGYLEVRVPNHCNALSCFHNNKEAVFNGQSTFYNNYVESSQTYWTVIKENILDEEKDVGELNIYDELNIKNSVFESSSMHPISEFILKEYERLINSHRCLWWKPILKNQYEVYSEFVKEYTDDGNEAALCTLNNKVQTVLLHINQATTPIYEVPYHNYYYSGSYNDVLRMYYGIIASLFNIAYRLPRNEETYQYEISYCVDFEATTKVHSSMYTLKNDKRRFVIFHLPYDAFMKFDKTVKLLLHEVFHYVAPYSRSSRNRIFVRVWIILIFEQYIDYLRNKGLTEENSKNIVEYFYNHYGQLCKSVEDKLGDLLNKKISNDFTTISKLNKLKEIPEKICEIICNELNQDLGLWLKEVKNYCEYRMVYPNLFSAENAEYFRESIRRIALATKEAFCDLNMIYILNLSLNEYVVLLFNTFAGKYNETSISIQLEKLIRERKLSIGSFEFRIGMVLDQYYLEKLKNAEPERYRDMFNEDIRQIKDESQSDTYKLFCEYLLMTYNQYLAEYRKEHMLFKELFTGERQWFSLFLRGSEGQKKIQNAASKQEKISENLSVILDFIDVEIDQSQLNINKKKSTMVQYSNISNKWNKEQFVICNLGEYVKESCRIIQEWGDGIVWFRGLCSDSFSLTPSLFRNLDPELSLYANQVKFLKDAYYLTLSEATLWTEKIKNKLEHMCLLQHYGIPTSLLDFSDDMLIALHFALNPDVPEDMRKVDEYIYQPKVVLFNPFKYHEAVEVLQKGKPTKHSKNISPFLLDVQDKQVEEYYVHDMSNEYLETHSHENTQDYKPNPRTNLYPRPLAIRRANARIHAQNGTFVAYNLSARPEKEDKQPLEYYAYLALERIQEDYLNLLENYNQPLAQGEFIKEIYINKMAIPTIKSQLKTMNVTTAHTYPELFRLFAEYMDKRKS